MQIHAIKSSGVLEEIVVEKEEEEEEAEQLFILKICAPVCVCVHVWVGYEKREEKKERERERKQQREMLQKMLRFRSTFQNSPSTFTLLPATLIGSFAAECCALLCLLCVYAYLLSYSTDLLALSQFYL